MLIKGIRSFSPDNTAVIEFYRPLTLIVGHNGAGKTVGHLLFLNVFHCYCEIHHARAENLAGNFPALLPL